MDLALTANLPRFLDVLDVILDELQVEKVFIAATASPTSAISSALRRVRD